MATVHQVRIERPSFESLLLRPLFEGKDLASATGFVVESKRGPVLITNRHVVSGRHQETDAPLANNGAVPNQLLIAHNGAQQDEKGVDTIRWKRELLYANPDRPLWIEHPRLGRRVDVVALPLTDLVGVKLFPIRLGHGPDPISCRPTEMVSVVGFPFGRTGGASSAIWAAGFIASEMEPDFDGLPAFLVDCRSRPGQSGSPVFAYRTGLAVLESGEIVKASPEAALYRFLGVYSGRIHPDSDIGLVWKTTIVEDLIATYERDQSVA
jgi:Trypsin-like peptidase domain